ncbi:uncharacterized protein LOC125315007 [Rhodamnia argentea]|uniref:Uncharacterized protein LOC125315007 n=1 Tax=Rhodamnia argentea TaxID=178133 RepID=A0ABM3HDN9_9MYRT|nr:uncharacterized protein LOC125315007 [Rhodamnia argentea]
MPRLSTPTSSLTFPQPELSMAGTPATIPRKRLLVPKKVSNFLRRSTYLTKMSKPITPRLALLKRSERPSGSDRAGNCWFLRECEFSPSRTPLVRRYCGKKLKLNGRRSFKEDVRSSLLVLCSCLGRGRPSGWEEEEDRFFAAGKFPEPARDAVDEEEGGDSVDLRAEMFIRRFYDEMRMQRRLSI